MSIRKRTAKSVGQRHELDYFKRTKGLFRWRRVLAYLAVVAALVWAGSTQIVRGSDMFSSGPLSKSHAFAAHQCETCHAPTVKSGMVPSVIRTSLGFRKHVTDDACLTCHQAPMHQANQTFTPSCASCHTEHHGTIDLNRVADYTCTQCHAALKTTNGAPHFATAVLSFGKANGHPQFAAVRDPESDPGTIKFNHEAHLSSPVVGPDGHKVTLQCSDCHRSAPDLRGGWKYGEASWVYAPGSPYTEGLQKAQARVGADSRTRPSAAAGRALMMVPSYANTCMGCHRLDFDPAVKGDVPHDRPEVVDAYVRKALAEYVGQHPQVVREPIVDRTRIPRGELLYAKSAAEWLQLRTGVDERMLWRKTCAQCHALSEAGAGGQNALPAVAASRMTQVWMPNAIYSHFAHQALDCTTCHTRVRESTETRDVLLPGIQECRACHNSSGTTVAQGSADGRCSSCHTYHNWRDESAVHGNFRVTMLERPQWESNPQSAIGNQPERGR